MVPLQIASMTADIESGGTALTSVPMILPHELFGALHEAGEQRWSRSVAGDPGAVDSFWEHTTKYSKWASQNWSYEKTIPLGIYGDSARVTTYDSLLVMTWNSVLTSKVTAEESRFVITALPTPYLLETSVDELCKVISWSFAVLADGIWPQANHLNQLWPPGSRRSFLGGTPLAAGFKGLLIEARGDWEWFSKCFHVPAASSQKQPCWRCGCSIAGRLAWTNLGPDAAWRSQPPAPLVKESPLSRLPLFHRDMIRIDTMHTCNLGVCAWVGAGALLWLCGSGHFGHEKLANQLATAWLSFRQWLHEHGLQSSQRPFTGRWLGLHVQDFAEMHVKAWNCRLIINWMDCEYRKACVNDEEGRLNAVLLWCCNEAFHLCEASGRVLSHAAADRYCELVEKAVGLYFELSRRALQKQVMRYPLRPKVHLWLHLALMVKEDHINPRFYHCFSDEGFLKVTLKAARASPRAAMSSAVVRRYLLRLSLTWAARIKKAPPKPKLQRGAVKRTFKLHNRL